MNFAGPGTNLNERLTSTGAHKNWSKPVDRVDNVAYHHDLAYQHFSDTATRSVERGIIKPIINVKQKFVTGVKRSLIKWSDELAEELHKPVIHHFHKRRVYVKGIDEIWAADLVGMQAYSAYNGVRYLLSVIDIFLKYGWLVPLKDNSGKSVAAAFGKILTERKSKLVWVDKGLEFYNKDFKQLVDIYSTENEEKSAVVERWNRTMKERMFKYFSANSTKRYTDVLDALVQLYNSKHHSTIKMTPVEASLKINENKVWRNLYPSIENRPLKPKFSRGDRVRITRKMAVFDKGYMPRWTEEVFTIASNQYTDPPAYKIKDENGEKIQGTFYEQELQKTSQEVFRIEKIIKTRGNKSLVK